MITSIEIKNFKSIQESKFDFLRAKYQYLNEYVMNNTVSNPIALYGHNGSGKSSFVEALFFMVHLLTDDKDKLGPFIWNLSDEENKAKNSGIRINFKIDGNQFSYSLFTTYRGISEEQLVLNEKVIFTRDFSSLEYGGKKTGLKAVYYPALRDLSNNSPLKEDIINKAYEYLSNIVYLNCNNYEYSAKSLKNQKIMDVIEEKSSDVKSILKGYNTFPLYSVVSENHGSQKDYFLSIDTERKHSFRIPYPLASTGMKNQSVVLSIILTMPKHGVLVIDEIESALHPTTIMNFLDLVIEKGIQLIFTSHNTFILSKLRPDNVFFSNWQNGYSKYCRLSEIYPNIREVNNIEKMYLSSTFDDDIEKAE